MKQFLVRMPLFVALGIAGASHWSHTGLYLSLAIGLGWIILFMVYCWRKTGLPLRAFLRELNRS